MVDRFLSWKLPEDFNPDGGVSFKRTFNEHTAHPMKYEPSGTNLLGASQATAMVRHMIEGVSEGALYAWLIEAPGLRYLASRTVGSSKEFFWTQDHDRAIRFRSGAECDGVMMAIRQLSPALFGFEVTIGDAKAVEHGWG
jgi:hypothetical protein